MWQTKDGKTFLDISKVDKTEFKVVSDKGLHLIFPRKNKWHWTEDEKWLRSVMVDETGAIVSCSWKKFGNFGEFLSETDILKAALSNGSTVRWTHKEDGSLMIRSVVNNQVILRTRGTMFGGEVFHGQESYNDKFRRTALNKYPKLLDPTWMNDGVSLLLEYISPSNAIVIRYKEEDLIFLGGVRHCGPSIISWDDVVKIADDGNLKLVDTKELPNDPIKLLEEVKEWKTEGVVARCSNDQVFVKVKSAWYLANHRMKYSMDYESIVEFVQRSNVSDESEFVNKLREYDYDFEVIESAKEFYTKYIKIKEQVNQYLDLATKIFASTNINENDDIKLKRKQFAQVACAQHPIVKSALFSLYDGKLDRIHSLTQKIILKGEETSL